MDSVTVAGFTVSGTVATAVQVMATLVATYLLAQFFNRVLARRFKHASEGMDVSQTSYLLIRRLIGVGIYLVGIGVAIYLVPSLRQLSVALFASAGFIGIVIGFAAQEAFSNIISGIFIALFRPFRVNDTLESRGQYGTVEDITLRHTVIRTPSNERVIVPNSKILNDDIINYSIREEKSRYPVQVTISYHDDIQQARDIMVQAADEHELTETGESHVIVKELADSGVLLELRIWAHDRSDAWGAGQELREEIKHRFDEAGITIPFPQRTVSYLDGG